MFKPRDEVGERLGFLQSDPVRCQGPDSSVDESDEQVEAENQCCNVETHWIRGPVIGNREAQPGCQQSNSYGDHYGCPRSLGYLFRECRRSEHQPRYESYASYAQCDGW